MNDKRLKCRLGRRADIILLEGGDTVTGLSVNTGSSACLQEKEGTLHPIGERSPQAGNRERSPHQSQQFGGVWGVEEKGVDRKSVV